MLLQSTAQSPRVSLMCMGKQIAAAQDPSFQGYYDQGRDCPSWAAGYSCQKDGTNNKDKLPKEYNEVQHAFTRHAYITRITWLARLLGPAAEDG